MELVKVKLCLCLTKHHAMKTYWGGGIALPIRDLDTRWKRVVSFTPLPLYPQGNRPWYPLNRRGDSNLPSRYPARSSKLAAFPCNPPSPVTRTTHFCLWNSASCWHWLLSLGSAAHGCDVIGSGLWHVFTVLSVYRPAAAYAHTWQCGQLVARFLCLVSQLTN